MLTRPVAVAVLVKAFDGAKERLASVLSPARRAALGRAVATRTVTSAIDGGADRVVVVTADDDVRSWAHTLGAETLRDPGDGLNAAAAYAHERLRSDRSTCVLLHADLPIVTSREITELLVAARHGPVLAPSHDGGTSALSSRQAPAFAYGPQSFFAHRAQLPGGAVLCRPGLALDLDTPADLRRAAAHPEGRWLQLALEDT